MKATELTEGMRVRCGKREGVVSDIAHKVRFQVTTDDGNSVLWFVDGDSEIEVVDDQEEFVV
jgi:hypothetical protein